LKFKFFIKSGFTLAEILIVIAILGIVFVAMMAFFNPKRQIDKAIDNRRKTDLNKLKTFLEDWYNDHGCYPKPSEICYDNAANDNPCSLCGKESSSPKLSDNFPLPCDPSHPAKDYLYYVDTVTCPQWYHIYAKFQANSSRLDPESITLGCYYGGCGIAPDYGYDYAVYSSNTMLSHSNKFSCYDGAVCKICGTAVNCEASAGCPYKNKIYVSSTVCRQYNP
jgi:prepilin-type N-terminal cleavage/methylation domain-containing protein